MFNICYKWKTPIELVFDKLIISLDGINSSNSPRQTDYPKYTTLATDTIALNDTFQNYFKESFFGDVICENCCSVSSETRQATFTLIKLKLFIVKDEYFFRSSSYRAILSYFYRNRIRNNWLLFLIFNFYQSST